MRFCTQNACGNLSLRLSWIRNNVYGGVWTPPRSATASTTTIPDRAVAPAETRPPGRRARCTRPHPDRHRRRGRRAPPQHRSRRTPHHWPAPASLPASTQTNVQTYINAHRRSRGLAPLAMSAALTNAAQTQANYMASIGRMTHTGAGGTTVGTRVTRAGFRWSMVGENIAYGQTSSSAVVYGVADVASPRRQHVQPEATPTWASASPTPTACTGGASCSPVRADGQADGSTLTAAPPLGCTYHAVANSAAVDRPGTDHRYDAPAPAGAGDAHPEHALACDERLAQFVDGRPWTTRSRGSGCGGSRSSARPPRRRHRRTRRRRRRARVRSP